MSESEVLLVDVEIRSQSVHAKILPLLVAVALLFFPIAAFAVPDLQLYIEGGAYDTTTQTWVTSSDDFTLDAIVNDEDVFGGQDSVELHLCVALDDDLYTIDGNGNIIFNAGTGITIDGVALSEDDFVYGLPPISDVNPDGQGGDLPPHDYYPTAFTEVVFTVDDPGAYDFQITDASAGIHFDLFSLDSNDEIDYFAPFSHDAETVGGPPVPEPSTLALMAFAGVLFPLKKYFGKKRD
jgi:hypothetical protein